MIPFGQPSNLFGLNLNSKGWHLILDLIYHVKGNPSSDEVEWVKIVFGSESNSQDSPTFIINSQQRTLSI